MAKSVNIEEFKNWIAANLHRTWYRSEFNLNKTLEIKYFYPSFDTRDLKIFYIKTDRDEVYGSHMDEHDSVLTALEARLNGEIVKKYQHVLYELKD